jgi:hypothetical protein
MEWRVTFTRSPREIKRVQVQQWRVKDGSDTPIKDRGISIPVEAIPKLVAFFQFVQELPDSEIKNKARFPDDVMAEVVRRLTEDDLEARTLIREHPELVEALRHTKMDVAALTRLLESGDTEASAMIDAVLRNEGGKAAILRRLENAGITEEEIANLTYRKQQLEEFRRLLNDPEFFESRMHALSSKKNLRERVWQEFFERNRWVFGYGLKFQWLSGMDDMPLVLLG